MHTQLPGCLRSSQLGNSFRIPLPSTCSRALPSDPDIGQLWLVSCFSSLVGFGNHTGPDTLGSASGNLSIHAPRDTQSQTPGLNWDPGTKHWVHLFSKPRLGVLSIQSRWALGLQLRPSTMPWGLLFPGCWLHLWTGSPTVPSLMPVHCSVQQRLPQRTSLPSQKPSASLLCLVGLGPQC